MNKCYLLLDALVDLDQVRLSAVDPELANVKLLRLHLTFLKVLVHISPLVKLDDISIER